MARDRLSMRKAREILRRKWALGQSHRAVARSLSVSIGTVSATVGRAREAGLTWPEVERLSEAELEARVYGPGPEAGSPRPLPDFATVHTERRRVERSGSLRPLMSRCSEACSVAVVRCVWATAASALAMARGSQEPAVKHRHLSRRWRRQWRRSPAGPDGHPGPVAARHRTVHPAPAGR